MWSFYVSVFVTAAVYAGVVVEYVKDKNLQTTIFTVFLFTNFAVLCFCKEKGRDK